MLSQKTKPTPRLPGAAAEPDTPTAASTKTATSSQVNNSLSFATPTPRAPDTILPANLSQDDTKSENTSNYQMNSGESLPAAMTITTAETVGEI